MDNFYDATRRIRATEKKRTCPQCEVEKSLSEFSPHNRRCKLCLRSSYVTCGGCKKIKPEREMEIYDKYADRYFCREPCRNVYYGIKRDKEGFVKV